MTGSSPSPATSAPPIDDWAALHQARRRSSWSPEARDAGALGARHAATTDRRELAAAVASRGRRPTGGAARPDASHRPRRDTRHRTGARGHARLSRAAQVRRQIRGAPGPVALAHSRLLLRLGGLARRAGLDAAFEPRTDGGPPADIRLAGEGASVTVEARVLLRDDVTLAAQRWLNDTSLATLALASRHDVDLDGTLEAPAQRHRHATAARRAQPCGRKRRRRSSSHRHRSRRHRRRAGRRGQGRTGHVKRSASVHRSRCGPRAADRFAARPTRHEAYDQRYPAHRTLKLAVLALGVD